MELSVSVNHWENWSRCSLLAIWKRVNENVRVAHSLHEVEFRQPWLIRAVGNRSIHLAGLGHTQGNHVQSHEPSPIWPGGRGSDALDCWVEVEQLAPLSSSRYRVTLSLLFLCSSESHLPELGDLALNRQVSLVVGH